MNHHQPASIVVGVDVGGLKKGFHPPTQDVTAVKPWRNVSGCPPTRRLEPMGGVPKPRQRRTRSGEVSPKSTKEPRLSSRGAPCRRAPGRATVEWTRLVVRIVTFLGGQDATDRRTAQRHGVTTPGQTAHPEAAYAAMRTLPGGCGVASACP
jgi:hypothetical protein